MMTEQAQNANQLCILSQSILKTVRYSYCFIKRGKLEFLQKSFYHWLQKKFHLFKATNESFHEKCSETWWKRTGAYSIKLYRSVNYKTVIVATHKSAAIALWFSLRLPFCDPGFESQTHHLCFFQFVLLILKLYLFNEKRTKINAQEAKIGSFLKNVATL